MNYIFYRLFNFISGIYCYFFSKKYLRYINDIFFNLTLKANGYTNYGSFQKTGENYFIKFLAKTNPKLCIDVGANIGNYSKILLTQTKSKIIAFEPLPEAFKSLKELEKNNKERFFPYNKGLSNKLGNINLFHTHGLSELATYDKYYKEVTFFNSQLVKNIMTETITLDYFYQENKLTLFKDGLDFIKIDTEGHEHEVLLGAKETIKQCKPNFIQIEINQYQLLNNLSLYAISSLLPEYSVLQILPFNSGLKKINPKHPNSNIFHLSNFVLVKKDISLE